MRKEAKEPLQRNTRGKTHKGVTNNKTLQEDQFSLKEDESWQDDGCKIGTFIQLVNIPKVAVLDGGREGKKYAWSFGEMELYAGRMDFEVGCRILFTVAQR